VLARVPRTAVAACRAGGGGWGRGRARHIGIGMTPRERYLQVARLHMRCLDQGFLATLGEGFLTLMYEAIDRADEATLLVAEQDGLVQGFITGGVGMGPIYRRMMRSPLRLGMALTPALLRPAKVRRILEIVRYSG